MSQVSNRLTGVHEQDLKPTISTDIVDIVCGELSSIAASLDIITLYMVKKGVQEGVFTKEEADTLLIESPTDES